MCISGTCLLCGITGQTVGLQCIHRPATPTKMESKYALMQPSYPLQPLFLLPMLYIVSFATRLKL
jgi:hypothetical protein